MKARKSHAPGGRSACAVLNHAAFRRREISTCHRFIETTACYKILILIELSSTERFRSIERRWSGVHSSGIVTPLSIPYFTATCVQIDGSA
jgi:hypothetical protein